MGPYTEAMPTILVNKPFRVLCQFSNGDGRPTLADYVNVPQVYAAGRLDFDSEGLLLLTDDGALQARISQPVNKLSKHYWVQVEGDASDSDVAALSSGVRLKDGPARALSATRIDPPAGLWPRSPPIRERKSIPDCWLDLSIDEGRNRQVRRMTAAVGLPSLRLIRHRIGPWSLDGLGPGETRVMSNQQAWDQIML